ncbi:MAG: type II toxin-antitoxin system HicA family toxin, partial [Tannerellaceae bacterium]|nr:type II toxin-antitoxin system HicA family toxin [Tannerellaceae bacterium]
MDKETTQGGIRFTHAHLFFNTWCNKFVSKIFCGLKQIGYICIVQLNKEIFYIMKYSEFYKLIEAEGWTIKKGKKHYKYVHPVIKGFISVARH